MRRRKEPKTYQQIIQELKNQTGIERLWIPRKIGTGSLLYDLSKNKDHGVIDGSIWYNKKGFNTLYYDGVDDKVDFTTFSSTNLSVELWTNTTDAINESSPLGKSDNANSRIIIQPGASGRIFVRVSPSASQINVTGHSRVNEWIHLVVTLNGSTNKLKMYADTTLAGSTNSSAGDVFECDQIGHGVTIKTTGEIGIVTIKNRVMELNEIKYNYDLTKRLYQ